MVQRGADDDRAHKAKLGRPAEVEPRPGGRLRLRVRTLLPFLLALGQPLARQVPTAHDQARARHLDLDGVLLQQPGVQVAPAAAGARSSR